MHDAQKEELKDRLAAHADELNALAERLEGLAIMAYEGGSPCAWKIKATAREARTGARRLNAARLEV